MIKCLLSEFSQDCASYVVNSVPLQILEEGLKSYLQSFAYSNAATDDLWNSMSEKAKEFGKDCTKLLQDSSNVKIV